MSAFGTKLRQWVCDGQAGYSFWCPGCNGPHMLKTSPTGWGFNGSGDVPTFTPSVLVTHGLWTPPVTPENLAQWKQNPWVQSKVDHICHSFVTDGQIQYLNDCTHALAGQTVPLPDYESAEGKSS